MPQPSHLRPRILQADGRRYSVKLEPAYWNALEASARRAGERVSRLVQRIAKDPATGGNLASALRAYCLTQAQKDAAMARLAPGNADAAALFAACPTPCAVVGPGLVIHFVNSSFVDRFGESDQAYMGRSLTEVFQFRSRPTLREAWQDYAQGRYATLRGRIIQVTRGRVYTAEAVVHPVPAGTEFLAVLWVNVAGR